MFTISGQKKLIATLIAIFVSLEKVFLCKERRPLRIGQKVNDRNFTEKLYTLNEEYNDDTHRREHTHSST